MAGRSRDGQLDPQACTSSRLRRPIITPTAAVPAERFGAARRCTGERAAAAAASHARDSIARDIAAHRAVRAGGGRPCARSLSTPGFLTFERWCARSSCLLPSWRRLCRISTSPRPSDRRVELHPPPRSRHLRLASSFRLGALTRQSWRRGCEVAGSAPFSSATASPTGEPARSADCVASGAA